MTVSTEEFDKLAGKVKEITELVEKNSKQHNETVEHLIKEALASHPGFTPPRKTRFDEGTKTLESLKAMREQEIVGSMPKEAQAEMDNVLILGMFLGKNPRRLKSWANFERMAGDYVKALDSQSGGAGGDWVPTDFSPVLQEHIRVNGRVVPLFPSFTMPTSPWTLPVQIAGLSTFKHAEQTADTSQTKVPVADSSDVVGNTTFTAQGHKSRVLTSKELEEDSIIPILPFLQRELGRALAEGREDAILNGDTAGTHEDSDTTSSDSRRKLFLGLRAAANDQSYKTDLGTLSLTKLRAMRADMGKYAVSPSEVALVVGLKGYQKLLGLDQVVTVEKYGQNATVLQGELGRLDGIPVIVSDQVREDLNASGVYDGTTTDNAVIYMVYRNGWGIGMRRGVTSQILRELYAESDQDALLITERLDFEPIYPIASNQTVQLGYNVDIS